LVMALQTGLHLGTEVQDEFQRSDPKEVFLEPSWFTRSAVIVGKSGTGKSHDVDLIAGQLGQLGSACVILDRTGEHAEVFEGSSAAKVLRPGTDIGFRLLDSSAPGIKDPSEKVEDVLDTLAHYFAVSFGAGPTPLQQRVIRENPLTHFEKSPVGPSVSAFISLVRRYQEFTKRVHGFMEASEAVVSRLQPLGVGRMAPVFDLPPEGFSIAALFQPGVHVVDLAPLGYEPAKDLLSQIV
jgi:hypothetical protein